MKVRTKYHLLEHTGCSLLYHTLMVSAMEAVTRHCKNEATCCFIFTSNMITNQTVNGRESVVHVVLHVEVISNCPILNSEILTQI